MQLCASSADANAESEKEKGRNTTPGTKNQIFQDTGCFAVVGWWKNLEFFFVKD